MTETCDWDDLVEERGLFYKKFSGVPFTGKVTGRVQGELKDGKMDGPWVKYPVSYTKLTLPTTHYV